jgi:hypothetical protein
MPFAISGLSIKTEQAFDLFVLHTIPQLPTRRNHRVTVSQSQLSLKAIGPVVKISFLKVYLPCKVRARSGIPAWNTSNPYMSLESKNYELIIHGPESVEKKTFATTQCKYLCYWYCFLI